MTVDTAELRRLHAAATPGPWEQDGEFVIARWHRSRRNDEPALHEWLGLTWDEYAAWVESGEAGLVARLDANEDTDT